MIQNVLITGCSYSANFPDSGWCQHNQHKHYSKILENTHQWQITNQAIGGCSNREIALRTTQHCLDQSYDLCIVQWSSLHRLWVYEADSNVDNWTIILPKVCGWGDHSTASELSKLFATNYLNNYMALKHWLLDQVMLQSYLREHKINYVFVRGFSNYVPELEILCQKQPFDTIPEIQVPDQLKEILNFDNNPNDYLYKKLLSILTAYNSIDKDHCIGYTTNSGIYGLPDHCYQNDLADDNMHPGEIKNLFLANAITDYCNNKGILV